MKILHFLPVYEPTLNYGGPVQSVARLCEGLIKIGIDIEIITTNAGLSSMSSAMLGRRQYLKGVPVTYYPLDRERGPIYSRELIRNLNRHMRNVDILHISSIWQPLGIPIQSRAHELNVRVLQSLRGALSSYSFKQKSWKKYPYYLLNERPLLQKAAGIHCTSEQELKEIEVLNLRAAKYIIANPIRTEQYSADKILRKESRQAYGIDADANVFLICGRQHHKKGLDFITAVLKDLGTFEWKLLLVGNDDDGSGEKLVQDLAKAGLGRRIIRLPMVSSDELVRVYNAADMLLLPSRHENFGNVVVEALSCGCQVAVSIHTGAASDLISKSPAGYGAVLPLNQGLWHLWLVKWLQAGGERAPKNSAEWAIRNYDQISVARRSVEVYRHIMNQSG